MRREQKIPAAPDVQASLQWGVGCLVGGAALIGGLILVLLVSIAVQPPAWVQIVLGIAMVGGALLLAWLFTSALRRSQEARSARPRAVAGDSPEAVREAPPPNG